MVIIILLKVADLNMCFLFYEADPYGSQELLE